MLTFLIQKTIQLYSKYGDTRSEMLTGISPEKDSFGKEFNISTYENGVFFLTRILNFILWFLGLAMLGVIIYGAYTMMTAAGNDEQFGRGKKALVGAIIGFIVVIISYAVVFTIIYADDLLAPRILNGIFN